MKSRGDGLDLLRTARTLSRRARKARGLPALWLFTDPVRIPDPVAAAARLPRGAGVVYRHFGDPAAEDTARRLIAVCRERGLVMLIGADVALARKVGAAGVHLPERLAWRARGLARQGLVVTAAAHGGRSLKRAAAFGAHAVFLSPVFSSHSPSAGTPMGPTRFAILARTTHLAVYALGGIRPSTAKRLGITGAAGLAAVEALSR